MKDFLQDIVQHTHGLGIIDLVKITGTAEHSVHQNSVAASSQLIAGQCSPIPSGSCRLDPISPLVLL